MWNISILLCICLAFAPEDTVGEFSSESHKKVWSIMGSQANISPCEQIDHWPGLGTTVINNEILDTYYHSVNCIWEKCESVGTLQTNTISLQRTCLDDSNFQSKIKSFCSSLEVFEHHEEACAIFSISIFCQETLHINMI